MDEEEADLDLTPSPSKPRAPTSPQATPFSSAHAHRRVSEFLLADMVFPSSNPTRDYSTTSLKPSSQAFSPSFTHKPFFNAALPGRIPRVCGTAILDFSRPQQLLTRAAITYLTHQDNDHIQPSMLCESYLTYLLPLPPSPRPQRNKPVTDMNSPPPNRFLHFISPLPSRVDLTISFLHRMTPCHFPRVTHMSPNCIRQLMASPTHANLANSQSAIIRNSAAVPSWRTLLHRSSSTGHHSIYAYMHPPCLVLSCLVLQAFTTGEILAARITLVI